MKKSDLQLTAADPERRNYHLTYCLQGSANALSRWLPHTYGATVYTAHMDPQTQTFHLSISLAGTSRATIEDVYNGATRQIQATPATLMNKLPSMIRQRLLDALLSYAEAPFTEADMPKLAISWRVLGDVAFFPEVVV